MQVPGVAPHYLLVLRREGALDSLEIQVEAAEMQPDDAVDALAARVRRRLHEVIGLTAEVTVVPPRAIERSVGKARRVLDLREQGVRHA
jgi:phenylacetate-CoA ligase